MNFLLKSIDNLIQELRRLALSHPSESEESETLHDAADALDDAADLLNELSA